MIGNQENNRRCPVCGGRLVKRVATIPYLLGNAVIIVKDVPAEVCLSCHEPFTTGTVTDKIVDLLRRAKTLQAEVLVLAYHDDTQEIRVDLPESVST